MSSLLLLLLNFSKFLMLQVFLMMAAICGRFRLGLAPRTGTVDSCPGLGQRALPRIWATRLQQHVCSVILEATSLDSLALPQVYAMMVCICGRFRLELDPCMGGEAGVLERQISAFALAVDGGLFLKFHDRSAVGPAH